MLRNNSHIVPPLLYSDDRSFNDIFTRSVVRWQMAIFYAGAGIWKLAIDHSNPKLSCSSMMLVQTLLLIGSKKELIPRKAAQAAIGALPGKSRCKHCS